MALTSKQLGAIHVARRQLGLSDDVYRAILFEIASATSATELDSHGFEAVIAHFVRLGWRPRMRSPFYGFRVGMASPAQLTLIRALWGEYTARKGTERELGKWLDRTYGVSSPRFITAELAPKAITALKAMAKRPRAATAKEAS